MFVLCLLLYESSFDVGVRLESSHKYVCMILSLELLYGFCRRTDHWDRQPDYKSAKEAARGGFKIQ